MISDYSDFEKSDLRVDVRNMNVSQSDLESIIQVWAAEYVSPTQLTALGNLNLELQAIGKLRGFNYNGYINTEQGDVSLNGLGRITNSFSFLSFEGPVTVDNFNVSNIIERVQELVMLH